MTISLICACKNRIESLKVSLSSWILKEEITEIIIVDWNSEKSLFPLTKLDPRIHIINVSDKKYFNLAQPLNLAASFATGEYILKMDCDYILNPYYNFFKNYLIDENSFVCGKLNCKNYEYFDGENFVVDKDKMSLLELVEYVNSYSPFYKQLSGFLFVSNKNFKKIGGYNENYKKYYGYEDDEILHRLKLLGLKEKKLNLDNNIIHIPHGDKIRIENHEGYNLEDLKKINSLSNDNIKYNAEYLLVMEHIERSKKIVSLTDEYYVKQSTEWVIEKVNDQNYTAYEIMKENCLENFPSVYYVSLDESSDRRENLEKEFAEYNIVPKAIISKRFSESDDEITGKFLHQMNEGTIGCIVSHLKAIRKWYNETDEDYGFFCEDDLSLETVKYWDFTWEEFIEKVPDNAQVVQLLVIRKNYDTFNLRERLWDDWSGTSYILTRDYAKILIETYCLGENKFHLELPEGPKNILIPLLENILFETLDNVCYSIPLFVENVQFSSTFSQDDDGEIINEQKRGHYEAQKIVLNYWKSKNNKIEINEIENLLTEYAQNPENLDINFKLGIWYWEHQYISPAFTYFFRCAERTEDLLFSYKSLIWSYLCYEKEGIRDASAKTLIQQALCVLPDRPEAYFLLSKFYMKQEQWQDTYVFASQGLNLENKNSLELMDNIGYIPGFSFLYEKAVSAWWWGKVDESKKYFKKILDNSNLDDHHKNIAKEFLTKFEIGDII